MRELIIRGLKLNIVGLFPELHPDDVLQQSEKAAKLVNAGFRQLESYSPTWRIAIQFQQLIFEING